MQTISHRQRANYGAIAVSIGTSLAILLLVIGCRDKDNSQSPEETSAPVAATAVSSDEVVIHYQVHGAGGPALVLVHGWSCDSSYWDAQVAHFSKQHKVVTIDLAGHGKSGIERANWTIAAFGRDVAAVVNKLDLDQVVLVGHSMGGDVIVEAVQQLPRRVIGLVLVDAFRSLKTRLTQQQIEQFLAPFRANFAETTDRFVRSLFAPTSDPALVEQTAVDISKAPRKIALACLKALNVWRSEQLADALAKVAVPIVAINSDMRPIDVQAFEGTFPSLMDDPKTFNRLLAEALREITSTKQGRIKIFKRRIPNA
jgi:pimeloyl-ACP methyl ester carboxylesterase